MAKLRFLLVLFAGCAVPRDTSRNEWLQHDPTAWVTTPGGHRRDAGPFKSVKDGFCTDAEIDAAIDAGFVRFKEIFPDLKYINKKITLNDDYVIWVPQLKLFTAGVETAGVDAIGLTIWFRAESATDPGDVFIKRAPGTYWGESYTVWRYSSKPLCPALVHELLHTAIDDPGHKDKRWTLVN